MAAPTIPNWPSYTDDDLVSNNGTDLIAAFFDSLGNAIQGAITGADNPSIFASEIIDEVIQARGVYASLDSRLDQPVVGTINDGVSASDIIDEVVAARDDNFDLNDRLDNFVADEIPDASGATRGLISDQEQDIDGLKNFTTQPTGRPGGAVSGQSPIPVVLVADGTQHATSGTGETDATSLTLLANTLNIDGKGIRIKAWGKTSASGTDTLKLYWNGNVLITWAVAIISGIWKLEATILREDVAKQTAECTAGKLAGGFNVSAGVALARLDTVWDSTNAAMQADETGAIVVKTTIQNGTGGQSMTQLGCVIELVG